MEETIKKILETYRNLSRAERKNFVINGGKVYTPSYTHKEWVTEAIMKLSIMLDILNAEYTIPTYGWDSVSTTHYSEWDDEIRGHILLHRLSQDDICPREENMGDFIYSNAITIPMLLAMGY